MKRFGIVGVYGEGTGFTTGQAVKCFELINWLQEQYTSKNVYVVNTYKWKKNPIKLFISLVKAFLICDNIIIMPAQHGLKIFAPLCFYLKKIFRKKVEYVVIGGWLGDTILDNDKLKKYIQGFDGIFVETNSMVKKLNSMGVNRCYYLPNYRAIPKVINRKIYSKKEVHYLCTYSRVIEEKGILDAIDIVNEANRILGQDLFHLDIYGKISEEFKTKLQEKILENNKIVKYCGIKGASEGIQTLSKYYCLLFPTYYEGEGFAGTVLDAFAAGIPTLANDWKYNKEIIEDGVNGLIYEFRNIEQAAKKLCDLYRNEDEYNSIQKNAIETSYQYTPDIVLSNFINEINYDIKERE